MIYIYYHHSIIATNLKFHDTIMWVISSPFFVYILFPYSQLIPFWNDKLHNLTLNSAYDEETVTLNMNHLIVKIKVRTWVPPINRAATSFSSGVEGKENEFWLFNWNMSTEIGRANMNWIPNLSSIE